MEKHPWEPGPCSPLSPGDRRVPAGSRPPVAPELPAAALRPPDPAGPARRCCVRPSHALGCTRRQNNGRKHPGWRRARARLHASGQWIVREVGAWARARAGGFRGKTAPAAPGRRQGAGGPRRRAAGLHTRGAPGSVGAVPPREPDRDPGRRASSFLGDSGWLWESDLTLKGGG